MFHMLELNSIRDHFDQGHSNYHDLVMFTLKYCKAVLSYYDGEYSGVGIRVSHFGVIFPNHSASGRDLCASH